MRMHIEVIEKLLNHYNSYMRIPDEISSPLCADERTIKLQIEMKARIWMLLWTCWRHGMFMWSYSTSKQILGHLTTSMYLIYDPLCTLYMTFSCTLHIALSSQLFICCQFLDDSYLNICLTISIITIAYLFLNPSYHNICPFI